MNLKDYLDRKELLKSSSPRYRTLCTQCFQSSLNCYCASIRPFNPHMKFVILIHPIEVKRKIASGRMTHLCLKNSEFIKGEDYSYNNQVNDILDDHQNQCWILYPGKLSYNITQQPRENLLNLNKKTVIFVIDGTWATARKTMRLSQNLKSLPQICFTPPQPSQFRVRKQPRPECMSTIEAVHHTIELLGNQRGFDIKNREHDHLLKVFDQVVVKQLDYVLNPRAGSYRVPRYIDRSTV